MASSASRPSKNSTNPNPRGRLQTLDSFLSLVSSNTLSSSLTLQKRTGRGTLISISCLVNHGLAKERFSESHQPKTRPFGKSLSRMQTCLLGIVVPRQIDVSHFTISLKHAAQLLGSVTQLPSGPTLTDCTVHRVEGCAQEGKCGAVGNATF